MCIRVIDYVIAALGLGGHLALIAILIRRKLSARLPLFTILVAFYLLRSAIFLLGRVAPIGVWPYWALVGLDPVLQLMLYVAIMHAWQPFPLRSRTMRMLTGMALSAVAASFSGLAAWYIGPSSHFSLENLSIKAGVFVSVLWIEAAIALAISAGESDRRSPQLTRKVVWGFAIYSAANVLTDIGHVHFTALRETVPYLGLSYMRVAVYLLCLAVWIAAFSSEPGIISKAAE
jgi:hypothetical protein